ncbi:MAG: ABC transporter permease [Planctomycetes bacterium]|nr:ABC transporter permease [Planctomycetota bacterium]MBI3834209.1 ABC transporter permease [Planctomycetota bacterium]
MSPLAVISEAFRSLNKNKARTLLSVLGIVIGISAVITMVAVGEGAKRKVEREIASLGDDWIMVMYWGMQRGGTKKQSSLPPNLTREDADAIERECSAVRAATPVNRIGFQVVSGYGNYQTGVYGCRPTYFDIRRWHPSEGREFNADDMRLLNKVCCMGVTTAKELFGSMNPVGQTVRINRVAFEVIGLLELKGIGSDGRDNDDAILVPFTSFERYLAGREASGTLLAAAQLGSDTSVAKRQIRDLLRQRHHVADEDDDDFRIFDRSLTMQANAEASRTFNTLLTAIASISLLVGGVGIMNIMLVSVTERTREIGLRMAIGANGSSILQQFLCEAIVLCGMGGILGFAAGWGVSRFIEAKYQWETVISYWMAGVAIAFAAGVGLFFGFYPAWRASQLNPIDALRYE